MGVFTAVHVPKVAWQSVVDPAGSKVGLVVVVIGFVDDFVVDEVVIDDDVIDDDVCSNMRGVALVLLCIDEGRISGMTVLRVIVLTGTPVYAQ